MMSNSIELVISERKFLEWAHLTRLREDGEQLLSDEQLLE